MTVFFVTRHSGAREWAQRQGITSVVMLSHFQGLELHPGDEVWGTLPINIVAQITASGARYRHLSLNLPEEARGRELTADDMQHYGARLETYEARRID